MKTASTIHYLLFPLIDNVNGRLNKDATHRRVTLSGRRRRRTRARGSSSCSARTRRGGPRGAGTATRSRHGWPGRPTRTPRTPRRPTDHRTDRPRLRTGATPHAWTGRTPGADRASIASEAHSVVDAALGVSASLTPIPQRKRHLEGSQHTSFFPYVGKDLTVPSQNSSLDPCL